MTLAEYKDGDVIFAQDSVGDSFYVIESGSVSIVSTKGFITKKPDGVPVELVVLGAGKCFGERALLIENEGRAAACSAKGDTKCLRLTREQFTKILGPMVQVMFPEVRKAQQEKKKRAKQSAGNSAVQKAAISDILSECPKFSGVSSSYVSCPSLLIVLSSTIFSHNLLVCAHACSWKKWQQR